MYCFFIINFLGFDFCIKVKQKFLEAEKKGVPVAGVIVEPIQAEGGDNHAHPDFFHGLQKVCKDVGISFLWANADAYDSEFEINKLKILLMCIAS